MTRTAHPPDTRRQEHWESVYSSENAYEVSWFQARPSASLRLIQESAADLGGPGSPVVDAGGGTSRLAGCLSGAGFTDVTVVDVCDRALATARARLAQDHVSQDGPADGSVDWVQADLLHWRPRRAYRIWHDRAAFHFLTTAADRTAYFATVRAALPAGGAIIIGTFAPDGPEKCSGLPVARYGHESLASEISAAFGSAVTITCRGTEAHSTPSNTIQPFTWISARLR